MSLVDLIRKRTNSDSATAIPAIFATHHKDEEAPVARIATVAVANPQTGHVDPLPVGALLGANGAGNPPAANDEVFLDWHALDEEYQLHHVNCSTCIAAGKGYGQRCDTGADLWRKYDTAPVPFDYKKRKLVVNAGSNR